MSDQRRNNAGESAVSQTVLHQFLRSSNCRHRLGVLPMAVRVGHLAQAAMSRALSGVDEGSVRLYNVRKDRQRGSAVKTKVGRLGLR